MPAKAHDFIWEVGPDFVRTQYLRPGPDSDLTGYTGLMQVRPLASSETVIVEISTTNGHMTLGNGVITLNVPKSVSGALDLTSCVKTGTRTEPTGCGLPAQATGPIGVYDLTVTSPDGVEYRLLAGDVVFSAAVSR